MPESERSSTPPDSGDPSLWVTVLAGGIGSRFWPVSTPERPKQLLPLAGPRPLIADTVDRARALAPDERIRILAGEHLVEPFRTVLPDLPDDAFLVEPRARGTAPVLAWAAWSISRRDPDAVLVSLHADHEIRPLESFVAVVRGAAEVARTHDLLVTVGARPERPETGYGYIQPGPELPGPDAVRAFRVGAFHEKPDRSTAAAYVEEGHLWNTGIFVWTAARFLQEVRTHAPALGRELDRLDAEGDVEGYFRRVPKVSVDVAVMERSERVGVVPAAFQWDDVGAWNALARTREPDPGGNVLVGAGQVEEGRNNVVFSDDAPVVLFGVDDLVVVRTDGMTLVAHRDRTADLKELLRRLPDALREAPSES